MIDENVQNELALLPQRVPIVGLSDTGAPPEVRVDRPMDEGGGGSFIIDLCVQGIKHRARINGEVID